MKDVYNHILLISTVAAFVKVPTVLLIMNFSIVFGNKLLFPSECVSFCRKSRFIFCFSCLVFCIEQKQTMFRFCLCMLPLIAS